MITPRQIINVNKVYVKHTILYTQYISVLCPHYLREHGGLLGISKQRSDSDIYSTINDTKIKRKKEEINNKGKGEDI